MKTMKYANLSPTGRAKALASDARDAAMLLAYQFEGTERAAQMDEMYEAADEAYKAASAVHRAAVEASTPVR
jgi:uncharacterized coiled-coil DUF342 family protein